MNIAANSFNLVGMALLLVTPATVAAAPAQANTAAQSNSPVTQVVVVPAKKACFSDAIHLSGFLVARQDAVIPLLPGEQVVKIWAGEGDRVREGQRLATVTHHSGQVGAAEESSAVLQAPADGVITHSTAEVGATGSVMSTQPLFRITVDGETELQADVPSIHVPALAVGQKARVKIGDRELLARVRLVPAGVDPKTQLGEARLSLERDPSLRPGMLAEATIDVRHTCGLSIPRSAVSYGTDGTKVLIVHQNEIETRQVHVGLHSPLDTEIIGGLGESDVVVANAGGSLRDGDKVSPIRADSSQTPLQ